MSNSTTTAKISHALAPADGATIYTYDGSFKQLPPGVAQRSNGRSRTLAVEIIDGRAREPEPAPSLIHNGFCLVSNFQTSLDLQNDGLDSRKIVDVYYPEIRELVVDKLGGPSVVKQAIIFDHTIGTTTVKCATTKR